MATESSCRFPPIDERLVEPETRQEMVRGVLVLSKPADVAHGDCHCRLNFVIGGTAARDYIAATHLLTRTSETSDFATDTCLRRQGVDESGCRYLQELAFEVLSEETLPDMLIRAEELAARGVRRIFAVFVDRQEIAEWSQDEGRFVPLPADGAIEDPTLLVPIPVRALFDEEVRNDTVARGLWERSRLGSEHEEGRKEGIIDILARSVMRLLRRRGLEPDHEQMAQIVSCRDVARLERWHDAVLEVTSVAELLAIE